MLEKLRKEMLVAFEIYKSKQPGKRDDEWLLYCVTRENYLKFHAKFHDLEYLPLKDTINYTGGH